MVEKLPPGCERMLCALTSILLTACVSFGTNTPPSVVTLEGYDAEYGPALPTTYIAADTPDIERVTGDGKYALLAPHGWHTAIINPMLGGNRHVDDYSIYLWSLGTGRVARRFKGHRALVTGLSVAPGGARFLSGALDGSLLYWDMESGRILQRLRGYSEKDMSIAFAAKRNVAATAAHKQPLNVWDLTSGRIVYTSSEKRTWGDPIAMSPEADQLAWVAEDGVIHIVDMASKKETAALGVGRRANETSVRALAFSPDGTLLAAGEFREVRIYMVSSGQIVARLRHPYSAAGDYVAGMDFAAEGKRLLTFGDHRQVFLWDIEDGRILKEMEVAGPSVVDARIVSGGSRIVALQGNSWDAYAWGLEERPEPARQSIPIVAEIEQGQVVPSSLTFSPDGKTLAAVVAIPQNSCGEIVFWNTESWQIERRLESLDASKVLTFSPDGKELVTSDDSSTYIRSLISGDYVSVAPGARLTQTRRTHYPDTQTVTYATFYNPQGIFYPPSGTPAVFARDGDINCRLWDLKSMQPMSDYALDKFASVCMTPDLKHFLTRTNRTTVLLCSVDTGKEVGRFADVEDYRLSISPDSSRFLACRDHGREFALYDIAEKKMISSFHVSCASINGPVVMLDSTRGLVTHDDIQIRLWDFVKGKELYSFYAHGSTVTGLAVSPDRTLAASVDFYGRILVWRIPAAM
jgi:WD40 repeat protein